MEKISVIVPVYNSEKYLQKCIDSLLEQDLDDVQFIFVNDGSIDESGKILDKYASDFRFIIINQENKGQGAARNKALDVATGEYIVFLDSDDYLERNVLKNIYNKAKEKSLDLLRAYFILNDGEKEIKSDYLCEEDIVFTGKECLQKGIVSYSLCENVYRREFLNEHKIRMIEGVRYEDMDFVIRATWYAKKMSAINLTFYHYVRHEGSVSNGNDFSVVKDYYTVAKAVSTFAHNHSDEVTYELFFRKYLGFLYSHVINLCAKNNFDFHRLINEKDVKDTILEHLKASGVKKYYIQYILIKYNLFNLYKVAYKRKDI
ncbi:MAG: glycosyltransferase [Lachnospiraceae bacterium]|nr:glycosyltransferase [Lachnospiraceae bacterium]